jgi:hypothetical protein
VGDVLGLVHGQPDLSKNPGSFDTMAEPVETGDKSESDRASVGARASGFRRW